MSVAVRCMACHRDFQLDQLGEPRAGFRCPFCGTQLAPGYASLGPALARRVADDHRALVTALAQLRDMTGERLEVLEADLFESVRDVIRPTRGATGDD